jgi:hypothetical protein
VATNSDGERAALIVYFVKQHHEMVEIGGSAGEALSPSLQEM